ncbi:MAG: PilZ domain-containing protein [Planctomycetota bacterium]
MVDTKASRVPLGRAKTTVEDLENFEHLQSTRDQLMGELEALRQRLAMLEIEMTDGETDLGIVLNPSNRREERLPWEGAVDAESHSTQIEARGVNLSENGLCFESDQQFRLTVRFMIGGELQERSARLAWSRTTKGGRTQLGVEFSDDPPPETA